MAKRFPRQEEQHDYPKFGRSVLGKYRHESESCTDWQDAYMPLPSVLEALGVDPVNVDAKQWALPKQFNGQVHPYAGTDPHPDRWYDCAIADARVQNALVVSRG